MTEQQTISPVDGSVYVTRPLPTDADIDALLARAVTAQREWRAVAIDERAAACERMVTWMVAQAEPIAEELTWQMGRPIVYGPMEIRRGFQERAFHARTEL